MVENSAKSKGLTPQQAEALLEDTVMLGTMMFAQNEVKQAGAGAVHTTADTVRPALQLIETAPAGSWILSSVFFMLMPITGAGLWRLCDETTRRRPPSNWRKSPSRAPTVPQPSASRPRWR